LALTGRSAELRRGPAHRVHRHEGPVALRPQADAGAVAGHSLSPLHLFRRCCLVSEAATVFCAQQELAGKGRLRAATAPRPRSPDRPAAHRCAAACPSQTPRSARPRGCRQAGMAVGGRRSGGRSSGRRRGAGSGCPSPRRRPPRSWHAGRTGRTGRSCAASRASSAATSRARAARCWPCSCAPWCRGSRSPAPSPSAAAAVPAPHSRRPPQRRPPSPAAAAAPATATCARTGPSSLTCSSAPAPARTSRPAQVPHPRDDAAGGRAHVAVIRLDPTRGDRDRGAKGRQIRRLRRGGRRARPDAGADRGAALVRALVVLVLPLPLVLVRVAGAVRGELGIDADLAVGLARLRRRGEELLAAVPRRGGHAVRERVLALSRRLLDLALARRVGVAELVADGDVLRLRARLQDGGKAVGKAVGKRVCKAVCKAAQQTPTMARRSRSDPEPPPRRALSCVSGPADQATEPDPEPEPEPVPGC